MKRGILFLISILVLIAAGISIYINYYQQQLFVRVVNLIPDEEEIIVSLNEFQIPYEISYGSSSEYVSLRRSFRNLAIGIKLKDNGEFKIREITLSEIELNSIFLYREGLEIKYLQNTTPKSIGQKETALRFVPQPYLTADYTIYIVDNETRESISFEIPSHMEYKILNEDIYYIKTTFLANKKEYSRIFLEGGELYTLIILEEDDDTGHQIRLLVDNLPGDQYITPKD